MSRHRKEGKLSSVELTSDNDDVDFDRLGAITDLLDFVEKVDRLPKEVHAPPGSLREEQIANIRYWVSQVRRFLALPESQSQVAQSALLHLMHASMAYVALLNELDDDKPSKKAQLTRGEYLEFRAKARNRKDLARLCGVSPQALQKWEDENDMPRRRR